MHKGLEISCEDSVGHEIAHVDDKHRHETSVFEGVPGDERKTRGEEPLGPPSFRNRPDDEKNKKTETNTDHGNVVISPFRRNTLGKSQRNQDQRDTSDKKTGTDDIVFVEELVDDVGVRGKMRDIWVMSYPSVPRKQDGDEGNSKNSVYD